MIGKLARGAYMLIVAGMVVAWAMSPGKSSPAEPILCRLGKQGHERSGDRVLVLSRA